MWSIPLWVAFESLLHPLEKMAKSSILSRGLIDFAHIWHGLGSCDTRCTRSRGQRSRSQRDNLSAAKNSTSQERRGWPTRNLVKTVFEPSATHGTCSRSLGQILISQNYNSAADCSISLKFATEFPPTSQTIYYKCTWWKVKGQGNSVT